LLVLATKFNLKEFIRVCDGYCYFCCIEIDANTIACVLHLCIRCTTYCCFCCIEIDANTIACVPLRDAQHIVVFAVLRLIQIP